MFLQPAIVALLVAGGLSLAAVLAAAPWAWEIARHWDLSSGHRRQVVRERRTALLSALVAFVLPLQMAALLLFVFTADRMSVQFVGAMCAVGTLQVDPWGFPALYAQIAVFFAAGLWLLLDRADGQARDYPLVRLKNLLLLGLVPLLASALGLQIAWFAGLEADVITSCCGRLFSTDSPGVLGDLAALPSGPARLAYFATGSLAILANARYAWQRRGAALAGLSSALAFVAALVGIVSFVAPAVYEQPTHHCPFCLLQAGFGHRGYALYGPLFVATLAGLGVGFLGLFRGRPSLTEIVPALSARLASVAAVGFGLFLLVTAGMLWRSNLVFADPGGP